MTPSTSFFCCRFHFFFMKINKVYYNRWLRVLLTSSQNVTSFKISRISIKIHVLTQETSYGASKNSFSSQGRFSNIKQSLEEYRSWRVIGCSRVHNSFFRVLISLHVLLFSNKRNSISCFVDEFFFQIMLVQC